MAVENRPVPLDLLRAFDGGTAIAVPPSARDASFDLDAAYGVEAELVRLRRAGGWRTAGRKVGFANKAMWRVLKLDTLVWAHMYDRTVRSATANAAAFAIAGRVAPRIEPEIVVKLRAPLGAGADAAAALDAVEWMALGFEINDCLFPDWKFTPADFVAVFGFHLALIVGDAVELPPPSSATGANPLIDQLASFRLRLFRNGTLVEEGSGKNALRSPALCLAELATAISRRPGAEPLAAGELISTGTLTAPQPIAVGDEWRAEVDGLDLPPLVLRIA